MTTSPTTTDATTTAAPDPARGWTTERKLRFLDHLAASGNVRAACRRVGLSPEAAYRLRRRDDLFSRGWVLALALAQTHAEQVLADRAIEGVEEPIYYRGELVGTRRRYDTRLLLAHLARLDKLVEENQASADFGRFDELLALIAGERAPEELMGASDLLPLDRDTYVERAARAAEDDVRYGPLDEAEDEDAGGNGSPWRYRRDEDEEAFERREKACEAAHAESQAQARRDWDAWRDHAYDLVDTAAGRSEAPVAPVAPVAPAAPVASGLPGNPLPPAAPSPAALTAPAEPPSLPSL